MNSNNKLKSASEFAYVFANSKVIRDNWLELRIAKNTKQTRLGLIVPKRFAKRAVDRNLIKRLAREAFCSARSSLPTADIVCRLTKVPTSLLDARGIKLRAAKTALRSDMDKLFARVK